MEEDSTPQRLIWEDMHDAKLEFKGLAGICLSASPGSCFHIPAAKNLTFGQAHRESSNQGKKGKKRKQKGKEKHPKKEERGPGQEIGQDSNAFAFGRASDCKSEGETRRRLRLWAAGLDTHAHTHTHTHKSRQHNKLSWFWSGHQPH